MNKGNVLTIIIGVSCLMIALLNGGFEALIDFLNVVDHKIGSANRRTIFQPKSNFAVLAIIEVLMLLVLLVQMEGKIKSLVKSLDNDIKTKNLKLFHNALRLIFWSWILIYLWLGIAWQGLLSSSKIFSNASLVWSVADALHCITIFGFFYAFITLSHPYLNHHVEGKIRERRNRNIIIVVSFIIFCLILSVLGRYYQFGLDKIGVLALGILSAFSMQYFIGILDSHNTKISNGLLAPLYFYVQLQIFWSTVDLIADDATRYIILIVAFLCKLYFFFFMDAWFSKKQHEMYIGD